MRISTNKSFSFDFDTLFQHLDYDQNGKIDSIEKISGLLFGDICSPNHSRSYCEIVDNDKLIKSAEEALMKYNSNTDKPMHLVLFHFAIQHLLRIGRILKQPAGHALLIGIGGSGK